jgi:hypothetical protein
MQKVQTCNACDGLRLITACKCLSAVEFILHIYLSTILWYPLPEFCTVKEKKEALHTKKICWLF